MIARGAAPTDPVCGTSVDRETSLHKATHEGVLYAFCGAGCQATFEKTPEAFVSDLGRLARRTSVSAALSAVVLLLAQASATRRVGLERPMVVLQFLVATPIVFWCGRSFVRSFAMGLRRLSFDADSLVGLGAGAAYGYSVLAVFLPRSLISSGDPPQLFLGSAAMIVTLVLFGKLLVGTLEREASSSFLDREDFAPRSARLATREDDKEVPIEELRPGDLLVVAPGERVPVDGVVRRGAPSIDEALLTGEGAPVDKRPGDRVVAGTLNRKVAFELEVTQVGRETTMARIARMLRVAQRSKPLVQALADRLVSFFVLAVIVVAAATFVIWSWLGGVDASFPIASSNALAVLVIAWPGALTFAAPSATVAAMGRGVQMGILFKSAETIELLSAVKGLVLNKAGTLTEGRFKVTDVLSVSERDTRGLLALAASAEKASAHPAGQAIVSHAHAMGAMVHNPSEFEAIPGRGVRARVNGVEVLVGNERLLVDSGVDGGRLLAGARHLAAEGKSALFVVADGVKQGIIGMTDPLKAGSVDAVARMKANGLLPVMLTGESTGVASQIGERVGLRDVLPVVSAQHKASEIEKIKGAGHKVAMVGDGPHDAPALARADVGVAIGTGPAFALDTADIGLVTKSLDGVVDAVLLSRTTMRIVRENLCWACCYNVLAVPIAAGVLYPLFGVLVSPVVAAAAAAMSSVLVVANALRLRNFQPSS